VTTLRSAYGTGSPSLRQTVCRLPVTFVHPTYRVELIFAPYNSFRIRTVCVKTLERNL